MKHPLPSPPTRPTGTTIEAARASSGESLSESGFNINSRCRWIETSAAECCERRDPIEETRYIRASSSTQRASLLGSIHATRCR